MYQSAHARRVLACALVATVSAVLAPIGDAGAKQARTRVSAQFPTTVEAGKILTVKGSVSKPGRGASVRLQQGQGTKWVQRARSGLSKGGFTLRWKGPARSGAIVVRAAVIRHGHVVAKTAAHHVLVKARVAVVSPGNVTSAPATGQRGTVVVDGASSAKAGDVIAMGTGPNTPNGFLGKVSSVTQSGGQTKIETQPTTLLDAVPNGEIDTTVGSTQRGAKGKSGVHRGQKKDISKLVSCDGGGSVELHGSVTVTPSVNFKAHWHWDWRPWKNGVDTASVTGTVTADAELAASAKAAASCSIEKTQIAVIELPPVDIQVGPVPVVLAPRIPIYVSADGSVSTTLSAGVHGSVSATAGLAYDRGDFNPIGSASASWDYTGPTVDATAELGGRIIPAFQLLLYGAAGPELAFSTGLQLSADTEADPWWTLSAPLDLNASLKVPLLDLESDDFNVYHHEFVLAQATNDPPGPPDPVDVAKITWDTDQTDIDLHIWNSAGDHAWYNDHSAIENGSLSDDDTDGLGPETFSFSYPDQPLAYGVCYYRDGSDSDPPQPTTVAIDWRDPATGETVTRTVTLTDVKQSATFGDTALVPDDEWC